MPELGGFGRGLGLNVFQSKKRPIRSVQRLKAADARFGRFGRGDGLKDFQLNKLIIRSVRRLEAARFGGFGKGLGLEDFQLKKRLIQSVRPSRQPICETLSERDVRKTLLNQPSEALSDMLPNQRSEALSETVASKPLGSDAFFVGAIGGGSRTFYFCTGIDNCAVSCLSCSAVSCSLRLSTDFMETNFYCSEHQIPEVWSSRWERS